ncbi:MAG TPA: hypothetical protein DCM87_12910, partial [Planctomycetes bacterium]|nr:hypothetical protein [Planctomycetota bacterium]
MTVGIACVAMIASAATLKVPGDYATIQAAINASANGDTVLVAPGIYREIIDFGLRRISLVSTDGADATVIDADLDEDGVGNGRVMYIGGGQTSTTVVEGFTIRNGRFDGYGAGIGTNSTSPVIRRNKIVGNATLNPSGTLRHGGGIGLRGGSAVVQDNVISGNYAHNSGAGIYTENFAGVIENNVIVANDGYWGGGIGLWGGGTTQPVVRNNLIYGNVSHGDARGGGIMTVNAPGALLVNNTVAGNSSVSGGGIAVFTANGTIVRNCIVWGNTATTGPDVHGTANAQWFFNDLGSDNGGGLIGANGNISA